MKHNSHAKNNGDKRKSLLFAQQIRKRDRIQIIRQIRIDYGLRSNVQAILNSQCIDIQTLYTLMMESKVNQANCSLALAKWIKQTKPVIRIQSKKQHHQWAFALSSTIEYDFAIVGLLSDNLDILFSYGKEIGCLQPVFALFCTILNIIQKRKGENQQIQCFREPVREYIVSVLGSIIECYDIISLEINQLRFYTHFIRIFPTNCPVLCTKQSFLIRICQYLEEKLDQTKQISQIIKILVYVTYYDEDLYEGVSQRLSQLKVFSSINFILQFMMPQTWESQICLSLLMVNNAIQNIGPQYLIQSGIIFNLNGYFEEPKQIPHRIVTSCIKTYVTAIQRFENKSIYTNFIKQQNVIEKILFILQRYGQFNKEIREDCCYALANILEIGQEQKQANNCLKNPYVIKLRYENAEEALKKYEETQTLLKKYNIEDHFIVG